MNAPQTVGDLVTAMPAPRASVPAVTPMQMLQIAIERGANLDMLERLMALQDRWEAGEARKAYVSAMTGFKAETLDLVKNKPVAFGNTKYSHATLDEVCDAVGPALARHGLSHRWEVEQETHDVIRVSCVIMHERGHCERVTLSAKPDTSGQKNAIQAIGSAVTYLSRYTLMAATGVAAREQDDDDGIGTGGHRNGKGNGTAIEEPALISVAQKDELVALIKETGTDTRKFLDYLAMARRIALPSIDALPAAEFDNAKIALTKKMGKK